MTYTPTTWADEVPTSTPVKYSITGDVEGVISASAQIEIVTPVTSGTPANATNLNHIEQGIVTLEASLNPTLGKTSPINADWLLLWDSVAGAFRRLTWANLITAFTGYFNTIYATLTSFKTGWIDAPGTWAYASATTITVPSGAAALYSVGDKFKLSANSVSLYGYIVGVADTLLTVAGDPLTNHAFTNCGYSKIATPQNFNHWFTWTPTLTGGNADLPAYDVARFCVVGRTCKVHFEANNRTLTGTSGAIQVTVPVAPASGGLITFFGTSVMFISSYVLNRTELKSGYFEIWKDLTSGAWIGNETIYLKLTGEYEI